MSRYSELKKRFTEMIWTTDPDGLPLWKRWLLRWARLVWLLGRDLSEGQLTLQAMSLVYTTLLSLVPLLAVSVSVLKGFGVHNQIEPMLLKFLAPLGVQGVEITKEVIGFVDNMRVGILGAVGLGLLLYTVVSLIQKVERAFNYAWHVTQARPLVERFSGYLSVILIGPVLVFSALGATASLMSTEAMQEVTRMPVLSWLVESIGTMVPYLFVIAAFTFVYVFVPNTRVRLGSAIVGALVAGFLWQTAGWGFAVFVVTSTKYAAIYSGFAILLIFMIWIYVAWLILLIGGSIAFYHQHPEYLNVRQRKPRLSNRVKERLGLLAVFHIAKSFFEGSAPWSTERLAKHLRVPTYAVERLLNTLASKGMLVEAEKDPPVYLPSRSLETVSIRSLLEAIRSAEEGMGLACQMLPGEEPVNQVLSELDDALASTLGARSLRDLVVAEPTTPSVESKAPSAPEGSRVPFERIPP